MASNSRNLYVDRSSRLRCIHQYRIRGEPWTFCDLFSKRVICACEGYEELCDSYEPRIKETKGETR